MCKDKYAYIKLCYIWYVYIYIDYICMITYASM